MYGVSDFLKKNQPLLLTTRSGIRFRAPLTFWLTNSVNQPVTLSGKLRAMDPGRAAPKKSGVKLSLHPASIQT
jgi:hypothetical protein